MTSSIIPTLFFDFIYSGYHFTIAFPLHTPLKPYFCLFTTQVGLYSGVWCILASPVAQFRLQVCVPLTSIWVAQLGLQLCQNFWWVVSSQAGSWGEKRGLGLDTSHTLDVFLMWLPPHLVVFGGQMCSFVVDHLHCLDYFNKLPIYLSFQIQSSSWSRVQYFLSTEYCSDQSHYDNISICPR